MIQIAILGRGGQGVVKASQLLANAAFNAGFYSQSFPFFGTERRGSPAYSYVRLDKKQIRTREHIQEADYLIILDSTLLKEKIIKAKKIILNSSKFRKRKNTLSFDASKIVKEFPQALNTSMIAAFCVLTPIIPKSSLIKACKIFGDKKDENIKIINKVFATYKK